VRKRTTLTDEEREIIALERAKGRSCRLIGELLGRHNSVVSREVGKNVGADGVYRAIGAIARATACRRRPKQRKLEINRVLHDVVNEGLGRKWSPQ
jgi:transposase, IS30 family